MPINVLYEDHHLLIVNKQAGIETHPNDKSNKDTLVNGVVHYLLSSKHTGYAQPIHRLDQDTSGAVIFAKHPAIKPLLDRLLEQRLIHRTYWALAEGHMKRKSGTINEPIGTDRHHNSRKRVSPNGQNAVTHYERLGWNMGLHATWLELKLDTGRTHQIRVHLSHIGHPIVADTLYGGKKALHHKVQALHAVKVSFAHPFTNEAITVDAPDLHQPPRFHEG